MGQKTWQEWVNKVYTYDVCDIKSLSPIQHVVKLTVHNEIKSKFPLVEWKPFTLFVSRSTFCPAFPLHGIRADPLQASFH